MKKQFVAYREDRPGAAWLARFIAGRNETERWYCGEGLATPSTSIECRAALQRHMPELLGEYDRVCALVGDDDFARRVLSHYRPPPLVFGCSQAVWLGKEGPALVRNYDFAPDIVSSGFESSSWFGREVISKAQRPWGGCLDGMNDRGLVASATFGGSHAKGLGFSVLLMLRYVLEICDSVEAGVETLRRIPIALSQNVTLLDATGAYATVYLGPDRDPCVSRIPVCTNHQDTVASLVSASSSETVERQKAALTALFDEEMTLASLGDMFLRPPLYRHAPASRTVYSAIYRPSELRVDYIWPGKCWTQRIGNFQPGEYTHCYGDMPAT